MYFKLCLHSGKKFEVMAKHKTYYFKATNNEICDKWVNGLNQRLQLIKECAHRHDKYYMYG